LKIEKIYLTGKRLEIKKLPSTLTCDNPILFDMGNEFYLQLVEINGID